jgi:para-nitrobenzyl esterase
LSTTIFACPALTADKLLSKYVPTYAYEFNDRGAPERYLLPAGFPYGAAHESEVQYLFSLSNTRYPAPLSPAQQHLAAAMQQDWTGFAKAGAPTMSAWSRFDSSGLLGHPLPRGMCGDPGQVHAPGAVLDSDCSTY